MLSDMLWGGAGSNMIALDPIPSVTQWLPLHVQTLGTTSNLRVHITVNLLGVGGWEKES